MKAACLSLKNPVKFANLRLGYSLEPNFSEVRCFFEKLLRRSRGLENRSACQGEFDQALEVKHDGRHEGLDTDLG